MYAHRRLKTDTIVTLIGPNVPSDGATAAIVPPVIALID